MGRQILESKQSKRQQINKLKLHSNFAMFVLLVVVVVVGSISIVVALVIVAGVAVAGVVVWLLAGQS